MYIRASRPTSLSESKIEAIYRCRASAMSSRQIARSLGIHQATVLAHLSGRYDYHPSLKRRLERFTLPQSSQFDPPDGFLTTRQVSFLLPDSAGEWRIRRFVQEGKLKKTSYMGRSLYRVEDVQSLIASEYGPTPEGVGIVAKCLDLVLIDETKKSFSIPSFTIQGSRVHMLWDLESCCSSHGIRYEIPDIVHSRVARRLSFGAKFVLIHEQFFL